MKVQSSRGFGLIELMIAVTIIGLLVVLGAPSYSSWMLNTRVRNASESIQNGIRLARAEAVQRGTITRFELTSGGADWIACVPALATQGTCGTPIETIQSYVSGDGASGVRVGGTTDIAITLDTDVSSTSAAGKGITFSALGRAVPAGPNVAAPLVKIDASSAQSGVRRLVTAINSGGGVRLCDPALDITVYPQGCVVLP